MGSIPVEHGRTAALRVSANFEAGQTELRARGIEFSFEDHEICHSIYFHDPDHYKIELTMYEVKVRLVPVNARTRACHGPFRSS